MWYTQPHTCLPVFLSLFMFPILVELFFSIELTSTVYQTQSRIAGFFQFQSKWMTWHCTDPFFPFARLHFTSAFWLTEETAFHEKDACVVISPLNIKHKARWPFRFYCINLLTYLDHSSFIIYFFRALLLIKPLVIQISNKKGYSMKFDLIREKKIKDLFFLSKKQTYS